MAELARQRDEAVEQHAVAVRDYEAMRDLVHAEQAKRIDLTQLLDRKVRRVRELERQLAELVVQLAPAARRLSWAVCQVRESAADGVGAPMVVSWPIGRETPGVHAYQLLRGPFDSEFEACVQLLLSVGAYPDSPEGFADACAAVARVRTRAQQVSAMASHPSVAQVETPGWHDAAGAQLRVVPS